MVLFTYTHDNRLQGHEVLAQLGIELPFRYEYPSSHFKQALGQCLDDYTYIIRELVDHISGLEKAKTTISKKLSHAKLQITSLSSDFALEKHAKEVAETRLQLLVSNFERLSDGFGGDMELVVCGTSIPAHSAIVSVWSIPFATMLQSPMREGLTRKIEIFDEEPQPVKDMVKYFYSADVTLDKDNALPLLRLSLLYSIDSLRNKCLAFVTSNVDINNCIEVFCLAQLHPYGTERRWNDLLEAATFFIKSNGNEVLKSPELNGVNMSLLSKIWPLIFTKESKESSELALNAFLTWTNCNWGVSNLPACILHIESEKVSSAPHLEICEKSTPPVEIESEENETGIDRTLEITEAAEEPKAYAQNGKQKGDTEHVDYFYEFCSEAIVADFENQCSINEFHELPSLYLRKILKRDDLKITSEISVLDAIHSWTQAWTTREDQLPELLECVRFPFLPFSYLLNIPNAFPAIAACPRFSSLLQEALQFQFQLGQCQNIKEENRMQKRKNYEAPQFNAMEFASAVARTVIKPPPANLSLRELAIPISPPRHSSENQS